VLLGNLCLPGIIRLKTREILSVGSGFVSIYPLHPETAESKLLPSDSGEDFENGERPKDRARCSCICSSRAGTFERIRSPLPIRQINPIFGTESRQQLR
jgi:hypothetical protein